MKGRCVAYGIVLMLGVIDGCSRGTSEQPAKDVPPAPPAAVATAGGYEVIPVTDGGSVKGTITLSDPVPKLPARKVSKDTKVCGTAARESQKLVVNKSGGLRNAVVIVEGV